MKYLVVMVLLVGLACSPTIDPPIPVYPLPSSSQLAWHGMEMNAFVHFSMNTFTDKEWGFGDEDPDLFNPTAFDADQWVRVFKETGFRGVILTCKHHDGFCLWPSKYTDYAVTKSPWRSGSGDVVREVASACKKYGLSFGVYLSPWDRNHKDYGTPAYLSYYRNQLTELFVQYGGVFEMWFDGANGGDGYYGGARERRTIDGATYYDWPATLSRVRSINPSIILFSDAGPGVRWVGNEKGIAGETNWCTITPDTLYAGKAGIERILNTGSEFGTHWIPAETDVSIRPGWFYHAREDSLVKSPQQLFDIYLKSVGRGSTLLLNVPPDRRGLLHEKDVASLSGFRQLLQEAFRTEMASEANASAESFRGNSPSYSASMATDNNPETYWATDDGENAASMELKWKEERLVRFIVVQEFIRLGQRIKSFRVDAWIENDWKTINRGTTIGYKRILPTGGIRTDRIRFSITDSKACPLVHTLEVY